MQIKSYFENNIGEIEQTPPKYSAIKVDGKRLYNYARKNQTVQIPTRKVVIHSSKVLEIKENKIIFDITVSKGTFIRSFVEDLGKHLNTNAILEGLIRTKIGTLDFNNKNLISNVEKLNSNYEITPLSWSEVIQLPNIALDESYFETIKNGNLLSHKLFPVSNETVVTINNDIVAIYEPFRDNKYKPTKVII